jgi:hypothetical protein
MNLEQVAFDQLYEDTKRRLSVFGDRFVLLRAESRDASGQVPDGLDFVYLDADHSYLGVLDELTAWFPKVRTGGIIGGHDYGHVQFPGVQQAVDGFFGRLEWRVYSEGDGVWWVQKADIHVSFVIPAFNCRDTVEDAFESIVHDNFRSGDEIIIVDDASTDGTPEVLERLDSHGLPLRVVTHGRNKGGGAARNTAAENARNALLFCLDADNLLSPGSIPSLRNFCWAVGQTLRRLASCGTSRGVPRTSLMHGKCQQRRPWLIASPAGESLLRVATTSSPGGVGLALADTRSLLGPLTRGALVCANWRLA